VVVPDETLPDLLPGGSVTVSEDVGDFAPSLFVQADVAVRSPDGLTSASSTGRRLLVPWVAVVFSVLVLVWASRRARSLRSFIRDIRKKDNWEMGR
jgi:hypothetical protein